MPEVRPLNIIASDISRSWQMIDLRAVGPLDIMGSLNSIRDTYCDRTPATTIVRQFLFNASQWQGDDARRIKSELRGMLPE
jgi:hypothetical protein